LQLAPFYPTEGDFVNLLPGRRIRQKPGKSLDLSALSLDLGGEEGASGLLAMVAQQLGPLIHEVGDPSAPGWPPASLLRYDQMSALDLLRQRGLSDDAIAAVSLGVADQELLQSFSALGLLRELAN